MDLFIAIVVQAAKGHSIEWLSIATLTPAVYLLLKKRKQTVIQKWMTQLFMKQHLKNKGIDKNKFGGRLLLSLLLGLGFGLAFGFLITWALGVAIGLGGLILGLLVVFKPKRTHHPEIF